MPHFEKTLDSTPIFKGAVVSLRLDTVMLENGATASREVIEHPGGVAVVALDARDNLYFVSQFRYPFGAELLELPAGKLEYGEDPALCGRRELLEECGCTADSFVPLARLYPTCAYDNEIIHIFLATGLHQAKQKLDEGEFLTVRRIPFSRALEMALDGELPDAKTQLGILQFQARRAAGRA